MIRMVRKFLREGNPRSVLAKKNIAGSFLVRVASIAISLVMVPASISYVDPARYGIWLVLSSVVGWVGFFDIGLTNGLRNRFAEAKARGDHLQARAYVSSAYAALGAIFGPLLLILLVVNHFLDWRALLNLRSAEHEQIGQVAAIIISYFCLLFVLRIVGTLLTADQKPALSSFLDMLGQLISLGAILVLTKSGSGSLTHLTLALCLPTLAVLLVAHFVVYRSAWATYAPSLRLAQKAYVKDLLLLGMRFFIPNLAFLIQFQTTSFLIAHYFDVTQVTSYNIAFKYFSVLNMVFTIVTTPLWSSVTESYNRGDEAWIRHVVNRYLQVFMAFVAAAVVMLVLSDWVYDVWVGKYNVHVGFKISLNCCLFVITCMFANIFVSVLNGIGALRLQTLVSLVSPCLFVLTSLFFVLKLHTGVEGILTASIISNVFGVVIAPIQYYQVFIGKSAARVWYA
jgi:O-antigen/teichoic acid export membrane protein